MAISPRISYNYKKLAHIAGEKNIYPRAFGGNTMSEEKKCIENEELCEEKREFTQEELERVTGGQRGGKAQVYLALNTITGED